MKDTLGKFLVQWRIRTVTPHVYGRLLDIGCGTNELVRKYGNGLGVDVYPWEGTDLVVDDSSQLQFEDQSFDTVTIIAALNHIPNRQQVVEEAHRVLRSGGRIIVTMITPRLSRAWHLIRSHWDADQTERGMGPDEVYGLTHDQVRELLEGAGFQVVREENFMLQINRLTIGEKSG